MNSKPAKRRLVGSPRAGEEDPTDGGHGVPPRNAAQFNMAGCEFSPATMMRAAAPVKYWRCFPGAYGYRRSRTGRHRPNLAREAPNAVYPLRRGRQPPVRRRPSAPTQPRRSARHPRRDGADRARCAPPPSCRRRTTPAAGSSPSTANHEPNHGCLCGRTRRPQNAVLVIFHLPG